MSDAEILAALQEYSPSATIVNPLTVKLEGPWIDVFSGPRHKWRDGALQLWGQFDDCLPEFIEAQARLLTDVAPARCDGLLCVAYCFNMRGDSYIFTGGMPLLDEGRLKYLKAFPPRFVEFYRSLHNGYSFIYGKTLGPLPSRDMWTLDEEEWEWLEEGDAPSKYDPLDEKTVVFSNGGGGYIVLDTSVQQDDDADALIWWKNEPPETEPFWPLLDGWMEIGLTND